jgi:2-amino-4-hydroxy-6-hydroxymethyldihydropteridine diphosphokinase
MTRAVLGLGANLGDARSALVDAVARLADHPTIDLVGVSGLWRTAPVGGPEQPEYLNAVVVVDTSLQPAELLALGHALESTAGRVRAVRWGPRTLDVDLIDVEGVRSDEPDLALPHPRAGERAFVLAPWAQVEPHATMVLPDRPPIAIVDLLAELVDQPVVLVEDGDWWR